ncbi:MAG: hypothetical protein ACKVS9_18450 [Phycisphaerae bacterium]
MWLQLYALLLALLGAASLSHNIWRRTGAFKSVGDFLHDATLVLFVVAWADSTVATTLGLAILPILLLSIALGVVEVETDIRAARRELVGEEIGPTEAAVIEYVAIAVSLLISFPANAMGLLLCLRQMQ